MNPQAVALNEKIKKSHSSIENLFSNIGKNAFYPKEGILKQAGQAKGKKINATIGIALFDDGSPMRLSAIKDSVDLDPVDVFPYANSFGKPEFRKRWKEMILQKNTSIQNNISTPVITAGLTHALSLSAYLFLNDGENIIMSDKFWGNYRILFEGTYGVKIKTYNTFKNGEFDIDSLKECVNNQDGKIVVLFNFPNNPSGYTPTESDIDEIAVFLYEKAEEGKDILVIFDDAYFGLVYEEGIYKESAFVKFSNLHKNILALKIDGATKEDYVWGLRVGCMTFGIKEGDSVLYEALEEKIAGAVRATVSNVPHISQSLVLKALNDPSYVEEKEKNYKLLEGRYRAVKNIFREKGEVYKKYFTQLPFNSGYFMCIKLKDNLKSEDLRRILLEKFDTGIIALGNLIRVAYSAVPEKNIEELFDNIYEACEESR